MILSQSPPPLFLRKRRKSVESTPPITKFFPILKRQKSTREPHNISQKLEDNPSALQNSDNFCSAPIDYSKEELDEVLQLSYVAPCSALSQLESLDKDIYDRLFTILDLKSLSSIALSSKTLASHVKRYTVDYAFNRRFKLDAIDFLNNRVDDEEFLEHDPYFACGLLLKSITITLQTNKRANVFLTICRNLNSYLGEELSGFGRILDGMTKRWKFSERRLLVEAAILIDEDLHGYIVTVLKNPPGKYIPFEIKIRSRLSELFLNRNQHVDEMYPEETIEFGAWLSILLRNFTEKYRGKVYYLLFGPLTPGKNGDCINWTYFENFSKRHNNCHNKILKTRLTALLNGIRALRIMSTSREMDVLWTNKNIYRLFLRVVESSSLSCGWPENVTAMSLAIDTSGLFGEYLLTCCNPNEDDFESLQDDAADMICKVRTYLYSWTGSPSTYMFEPLQISFMHLAKLDGGIGGKLYKQFLDKIWAKQNDRIDNILGIPSENQTKLLNIELGGQLSVAHLFCCYHDMITLQTENEIMEENRVQMHQYLRDLLIEQEEQLEEQLEEY